MNTVSSMPLVPNVRTEGSGCWIVPRTQHIILCNTRSLWLSLFFTWQTRLGNRCLRCLVLDNRIMPVWRGIAQDVKEGCGLILAITGTVIMLTKVSAQENSRDQSNRSLHEVYVPSLLTYVPHLEQAVDISIIIISTWGLQLWIPN